MHLNHKLYKIEKTPRCEGCGREISVIWSAGSFSSDDQKATKETSCKHCNNDVVITFKRVKPEWVKLAICGQEFKIESIQTCSERWCMQEFLIESEGKHIQYDRAEEWHVPIQCPHCLCQHWINLYKLDEN